jgi:hypothetical protein
VPLCCVSFAVPLSGIATKDVFFMLYLRASKYSFSSF